MRKLLLAVLILAASIGQAQNPSNANIIVVGNKAQPVQFTHSANIQQAITDAGPQGIVWIPADYPFASETYSNPNNIVVWDMRNNQFKLNGTFAATFLNALTGIQINGVSLNSQHLQDASKICMVSLDIPTCNFQFKFGISSNGFSWSGSSSGQQDRKPNATIGGSITGPALSTGNGFEPVTVANIDLTAQAAAITSTLLYAVPAAGPSQYTICYSAVETLAATTSSTLGAFQITYTESDDSVVKTMPGTTVAGLDTNATNSTSTGTVGRCLVIHPKVSTNVNYVMAYTTSGATGMQYNLHIKMTGYSN